MQLLVSGAQDSKTMSVIQPSQLDSKQGTDNIWVITDYLQIFPCSQYKVFHNDKNNNRIA